MNLSILAVSAVSDAVANASLGDGLAGRITGSVILAYLVTLLFRLAYKGFQGVRSVLLNGEWRSEKIRCGLDSVPWWFMLLVFAAQFCSFTEGWRNIPGLMCFALTICLAVVFILWYKQQHGKKTRDEAKTNAASITPAQSAEFTFACPHCGQHLRAEADMIGMQVACPACQNNFVVQRPGFGETSPRPIAPLLFKARMAANAIKDKVLTIWRNSKDGRYAFFDNVKIVSVGVRDKTVSLWKSGIKGKAILCVVALLALWFVWPSGKGEAEAKREAEMTVEDVRHKIVDALNGELSNPSSKLRKRIEDAHVTVTVSHAYVLKCDVTTFDGSDKAKNISLVTVTIRFNWDGIVHQGGTTDLEVELTADGKCVRSRIVRTDAMVNAEDPDFWYNVGYGIGELLAL